MPHKRKASRYWWISYTDASGKRVRRSTGTTDRKEAKALEAKWRLSTFKEQQWDEQPERTFDELMLAYLKATKSTKPSHGRDICSMRHLRPVFRGRRLSEIDTVTIRSYIRQRRSDGAAASTINKEIGVFSSAISYAQKEGGWRVLNPVKGIRLKEPAGRVRWLTNAESQALIEAASDDPRARHLPDFITLALHTGMRKGELLGLEWCRVDLQRNLVYLEAEHTKTKRRRSIPINADARGALLNRAQHRADQCPDSPWVFCHRSGQRIQDVKTSFATACKRAEIANFRIHDLRHTCAAWLVQAGTTLDRVRDLLGHSSITTTEIYAHLNPDNVREAVDLLASTSHFRHSDRVTSNTESVSL